MIKTGLHRIHYGSVLIIICVLTVFPGCLLSTPDDEDFEATDAIHDDVIDGKLLYDEIHVINGSGIPGKSSPKWIAVTDSAQSVGYSIDQSSIDAGISIDPLYGDITVTDTVAINSYKVTVTATGKGDFTGTITSTADVTVIGEATLIDGTLSYRDFSSVLGHANKTTPIWSSVSHPDQTVNYAIDNNALSNGILINSLTGDISIIQSANIGVYTVTVTARGIGAYSGLITTDLIVEVTDQFIIIDNSLSYNPNNSFSYGNAEIIKPTWQNVNTTANYVIEPDTKGIAIDDNGQILISADTALQTTTPYKITATGYGSYSGISIVEINIEINRKTIVGPVNYAVITVVNDSGTAGTQLPEWPIGTGAEQTVEYSLNRDSLDVGMTIDTLTGEIAVPDTLAIGTYTATVTITGTGNYIDSLTVEVKIMVIRDTTGTTDIHGSLIYNNIVVLINSGVDGIGRPMWTLPDVTAHFSLNTEAINYGIVIHQDTGIITVSNTLPAKIMYLTVTATGTNLFSGSAMATLMVDISNDRPPDIPTGVTAIPGNDLGSVDISWIAPNDFGVVDENPGSDMGYFIYHWTGGIAYNNHTTITVSPGTTNYTIENLTLEIEYSFQIRSTNERRTSSGSDIVLVYPQSTVAPGAPTNLIATPSSTEPGKVSLTWTAPVTFGTVNGNPGTDNGYTIYWRSDEMQSTNQIDVASGITTEEMTGLTADILHHFFVTAKNESLESEASSIVTATPTGP